MTATILYLIRHGATSANRATPYRLQGRALDLPLDEVGEGQARRAAAVLGAFPLSAVYTSPLLRARETAGWIARPHGIAPEAVPDLIEASLGRWEGLTWDQVREAEPGLYRNFQERSGEAPYPEGESFLDAQRRMVRAVSAIASANPGRRVAVVGHNVTNRAYLAHLMGVPIGRARAIRQANGGINTLETHEDGSLFVQTLNARFHLDDPAT